MSPPKRRKKERRSEPQRVDEDGVVRRILLRVCAVAALAVLVVLGLVELSELRGELAFERFYHLRQVADKLRRADQLTVTVSSASSEANLVILFARRSPDALREVTTSCLHWAGREELDPILRLRLAEKAVRAGMLAVRAAPSDYYNWLCLARAHAALGLWEQAQHCLKRACDLAPPGTELELLSS